MQTPPHLGRKGGANTKTMKNIRRRSFIEKSAKGMAAAGIIAVSSCNTQTSTKLGGMFIHHVFFWLKEPITAEIRSKFEQALRDLVKVETIVDFHLGIPAGTSRDVIDASYAYSLLTTFKNKEDQDVYQTHPIHLKFIEENSMLWEKVVVYDTIEF